MDFLKELGWKLSAEGLSTCQDLCKEKRLTTNGKNLLQVALDLDLRSISEPTLSDSLTHSGSHQVEGPLVLQIQKVKNVAVTSGNQHNPSPSKRLLRLLVTDGHINISAAEIDGPIEKLSPVTPPGTKMRLSGTISVVNGFILLKKSSSEVFGGSVESLLKKWHVHKAVPDNLDRNKGEGKDGPPPFVKFSKMQTASAKPRNREREKGSHREQSPAVESAPTREQMELPASYRAQNDQGVKERRVPGLTKKQGEYASSSGPQSQHLISQYVKLSLAETQTADIEDLVESGTRTSSRYDTGSDRTQESSRGPDGNYGRFNRQRGRGRGREGERMVRDSGEREPHGRGRGRGRRRDRDEEDDYHQQRRRENYQLSDFLERQETPKGKPDDVLEDYEYDRISDQYYPKVKPMLESERQKTSKEQPDDVLKDYEFDPISNQYYPKVKPIPESSRFQFQQNSPGRKEDGGDEGFKGRGRDVGGRGRSDVGGRGRSAFDGGRSRSAFDGGERRGVDERRERGGGRGKSKFSGEREGGGFDGDRWRSRTELGGGKRGGFDGHRRRGGSGFGEARSEFNGGRGRDGFTEDKGRNKDIARSRGRERSGFVEEKAISRSEFGGVNLQQKQNAATDSPSHSDHWGHLPANRGAPSGARKSIDY